jgi:hypothetical protein
MMIEHKDDCEFKGFSCCVNRKGYDYEVSLEVCEEEIHFYCDNEEHDSSIMIEVKFCPSCGVKMWGGS